MEKFKRLLPTLLMLVFEIAIGVMLLIDGEKLTGIIFIIFGVLMLVGGIINLIVCLVKARKGGTLETMPLVMSVIMIAIGGFFTAASGSVTQVVSTITMIYGVIMTINGVIKLADYLAFRTFAAYGNGFIVFSAVLSILFGIVIAFNPFGTALVIWTLLGIALLVSAGLDIITLIIYGKALRQIKAEASD